MTTCAVGPSVVLDPHLGPPGFAKDKGFSIVQQQQQQQQQQQSCDAGQEKLVGHTPNYPTFVDQRTQRSAFDTPRLSSWGELHGTSGKPPSEAQSSKHVAHERPHTLRRLSNKHQNSESASTLLQQAVQAAPGSQALQGAAALQHDAVPLSSPPLMYKPLAQRLVKRQSHHPMQHERPAKTKPDRLQLSQEPVHRDAPVASLSGAGEQQGLASVPTMMCYPAASLSGAGEQQGLVSVPTMMCYPAASLSGTGEQQGLVSVPTMICYPAAQSWLPLESFALMLGDSAVEQTVVDSQRNIAVRCAPQATVVAKSAQVKKPNKCLCIKRESCCC